MLTDFRESPQFEEVRCDVCIIGSGAAGITLALELDGSGLGVVVLAGGPARNEPESQDLYRSRVVGLKHVGIHEGRARVHGGSTTLWKGQSLTLDPIDFRHRDWVPFSGWPFGRETLDPFYLRADRVMKLPTIAHDETSWPENRPKPPKFTPQTLHARLSQFTAVPDFSVMYREDLKKSANITVFTNAHATNLVINREGTRLDSIEVKSLDGRTNTLRPRAAVVCCGAIDTARLLLASDSVDPRGVGNTHDLVGRFFQEHIQGKMTVIRPSNRKMLRETFGVFADKGTRYAPKICTTEELQRREEILNVYGDLCYEMPEDSAVEAAKVLVRAARRPDLRAKVPRALWDIAKRPHEVVMAAAKYAIDRTPMTPTRGPIYLGVQAEQAPNPDSRVTLGEERDALGMRRSVLDWRVTGLDRRSLSVYVKAVSEEFARVGLGEVDLETFHLPDDLSKMDERIIDCNHHIGTTRMSDDPKSGVVDRECRVHGIGNLSIGSSAVFPTGGASNPTLTIIALCVRMADRLKRNYLRIESRMSHGEIKAQTIEPPSRQSAKGRQVTSIRATSSLPDLASSYLCLPLAAWRFDRPRDVHPREGESAGHHPGIHHGTSRFVFLRLLCGSSRIDFREPLMTIPTVTLPGTNLTTTALGFGCNALLGPKSRREGLNLLAAAYDAGIRHFDVARAYSSGDAEGLLGEFLAEDDRRSKVTITTKFGLQPPSGGVARLKFVKTVARKLMRLSPGLRKAIGARSGKMVQQGAFSPEQARASLETSLKELRTDRVEILLLHEATAADCTPELLDVLLGWVKAGRIGHYGVGVGSEFSKVEGVAKERPEYSRILQFESSEIHRNLEALNPPSSTATITHGAIGRSFSELRAILAAKPEVRWAWSDELGLDLASSATLAPLMLASALRSNPGGIVLFSSTRPGSIRENVEAIEDERFSDILLERFGTLVAAEFPPSPLGGEGGRAATG